MSAHTPLSALVDENDSSAWAVIRKAVMWLRVLAHNGAVPAAVGLDAGALAEELAAALPGLGGGPMEGSGRGETQSANAHGFTPRALLTAAAKTRLRAEREPAIREAAAAVEAEVLALRADLAGVARLVSPNEGEHVVDAVDRVLSEARGFESLGVSPEVLALRKRLRLAEAVCEAWGRWVDEAYPSADASPEMHEVECMLETEFRDKYAAWRAAKEKP